MWFAVGMHETIAFSKVDSIARMFRGILLPVFLLLLYGLDVRVWKKIRVNYVFIFEKHPKTTKTWAEVLEVASMLGAVWAFYVLFYTLAAYYSQPTLAEYTSLMLAITVLLFLFNPFRILALYASSSHSLPPSLLLSCTCMPSSFPRIVCSTFLASLAADRACGC